MELMDEVYGSNKSIQAVSVAVVAHEIGHLLGAPEVFQTKYFKLLFKHLITKEVKHYSIFYKLGMCIAFCLLQLNLGYRLYQSIFLIIAILFFKVIDLQD
jgi:Zn-dependent membrane protease YugP